MFMYWQHVVEIRAGKRSRAGKRRRDPALAPTSRCIASRGELALRAAGENSFAGRDE